MIDSYKHIKPNLLFLGAPGAGKGSVATKLVEKYGYYQLSTGDMFRQEIKNKTDLGLKIQSILDAGNYVSDDITNELVKKTLINLHTQHKPFILDGYPRTLDQAKFLKSLESLDIKIDYVVLLEITDEQVIKRLEKRRICPKCKTIYHMQFNPPKDLIHCDNISHELTEVIKRPDDDSEVIKKRLNIYNTQTAPLIKYYEKNARVVKINSYQAFDKVLSQTVKAIGELNDNY